jgi:hypothetical protein
VIVDSPGARVLLGRGVVPSVALINALGVI